MVSHVLIWADKDASATGRSAGNQLKLKLNAKGVAVSIIEPNIPLELDEKGIDWNDVLIEQGYCGFSQEFEFS